MAVFRRPELEKDNPIAPQMYVGPRRRRALLREASLSSASRQGDMAETLLALTAAAERFLRSVWRVSGDRSVWWWAQRRFYGRRK